MPDVCVSSVEGCTTQGSSARPLSGCLDTSPIALMSCLSCSQPTRLVLADKLAAVSWLSRSYTPALVVVAEQMGHCGAILDVSRPHSAPLPAANQFASTACSAASIHRILSGAIQSGARRLRVTQFHSMVFTLTSVGGWMIFSVYFVVFTPAMVIVLRVTWAFPRLAPRSELPMRQAARRRRSAGCLRTRGGGRRSSGFVQRYSRMADGVVLHTNLGVHIGLAPPSPPASVPSLPPAAPRDGGSWYWCSTMGEWVESMDGSDVPPDPRGLCLGTDNLVGDGSRPSRGRYRDPLEDLMASTEDPGAYYQGLAYPSGDDSDGSSGEFSFDGIVEHMRAATISQSPAPHAASFALADDVAAPLPRGLRWLRSAWRAVVERSLCTGHHFAPRRFPSESDYDYLLRVGFYHDDPFGEAGFGWCDAVDAGWPEGHLGGQVFSLFHDAYYTSLWARCMWRRALRGAQRMLMSERGLAWLALRNAQTQMRVALRSLVAERRRSAFLWLGGRAEHTRRLDHLQGAWCAAARRVLECRAVLHTPVRARPRRRRVRGRGTG